MGLLDRMAELTQLNMEAYALRHSIDGRRRVLLEALREAYEQGGGRLVGEEARRRGEAQARLFSVLPLPPKAVEEISRLRAQVLEYAEALAATRRESEERLTQIQILYAAVPSAPELDLLDSAVGAAYHGERTIDANTYTRLVEWLSIAEEALKHFSADAASARTEPGGGE